MASRILSFSLAAALIAPAGAATVHAQDTVAQLQQQAPRSRGPTRPGVRVVPAQPRRRGTVRVVVPPPPAPRVEVRPAQPRQDSTWQEGHWRWDGRQHRWAPGRWSRTPRGRTWHPPRWEQRPTGWVLVPGQWVIATQPPPPPIVLPPAPPPPPGTPLPFQEYGDEDALPMVVPLAVAIGVPAAMQQGGQPAFWIWADPNGVWHLRVTSPPGEWRRFQGRVAARRGSSVRLTAMTRLELRDRVQERPRALVFDFQSAGGIDGIDFTFDGQDCARFRLRIDGDVDGAPKAIFLGSAATPAPAAHFLVCR